MNVKRLAAVAALPLVAGLMVAGPAASASVSGGGQVIANGNCSQGASWKLKAKHDDSQIEMEFEVDSNVSGQVWNVKVTDNGQKVFKGTQTTGGASGSFSLERRVADLSGADKFVARATNKASGETCKGTVTLP